MLWPRNCLFYFKMLHYANKKEIVNNNNSKLKLLITANRLIADHKGWQKLLSACRSMCTTQCMIYLILLSKLFVFSKWTQQTFACSKSTIRTKYETYSHLTKNPTRTTPLTSFYCLHLNSFHSLFMCLSF